MLSILVGNLPVSGVRNPRPSSLNTKGHKETGEEVSEKLRTE